MRIWIRWPVAAVFALLGWQSVQAAEPAAAVLPVAYSPAIALGGTLASTELARHVTGFADNGNLPFAIVDKNAATIAVYRHDGSLAGISTALLGLTRGDRSSPGAGQRAQIGELRMEDRTTPAGRFESVPGRNLTGEPVVWVDYSSALAIHRLRPAPAREKRPLRMASSNPLDKRISAGCVVVPEAFYDTVVQPVLGNSRAVIYVMPEDNTWQRIWHGLAESGF